jgi:hypothetical protein
MTSEKNQPVSITIPPILELGVVKDIMSFDPEVENG